MKKSLVCLAIAGIFPHFLFSQTTNGFSLSMVNGYNSFLNNSSQDSVFFLKSGINLGLQGTWFSNNIGIGGKAGYLANAVDNKKLSDFGTSRKATIDRSQQNNSPYNGYYFMAGPAFKSDFKKLQVHTSLMAGMYSGSSSQNFLGDKQATDITYYKNVISKTSSFTWTAGMGADYSLTSNMQLGLSADYQSMKRDVTNYDILRGNGREAKDITGQVNFLNTAIRLTYVFGGRNHNDAQSVAKKHLGNVKYNDITLKKFAADNSEANSERQRPGKVKYNNINLKQQHDTTCNCENQVMDVVYLEPSAIDVTLNSMNEAQDFLKTCGAPFNDEEYLKNKNNMQGANNNPMYKDGKMEGKNPLYQETDFAIKENGVKSVISQGDDNVYKKEEFAIKENGVKSIVSPRDPSSGMATGRRMHKPFPAYYEESTDTYELNGKYYIATAREASSGMATGKRMHQPFPGFYNEETDIYELNGKFYSATAREASSGMATGKRMHKPFPAYYDETTNTYELSGKYFVATAREASSGMATGKLLHLHKENIIHRDIATRNVGNVDGDNETDSSYAENRSGVILVSGALVADGGVVSMNTRRTGVILRDDKGKQFFALFPDEIDLKKLSQTDGGSIAINFTKSNTGPVKWMAPESLSHKNISTVNEDDHEKTDSSINKQVVDKITTPRDNPIGLPAGKRMHKPVIINYDAESNTIIGTNGQDYSEIQTALEASSGMATGKRMHKPYLVDYDAGKNVIVDSLGKEYTEIQTAREASSGMATGKRMHKPYLVDYDAENNVIVDSLGQQYTEVVTAREAGSGMATGKRMHKPFIVTAYSENNEEIQTAREAGSGMATGRYKISCSPNNIEYGDDGSRKINGTLYMNGIAYPAVFTFRSINDTRKNIMSVIR